MSQDIIKLIPNSLSDVEIKDAVNNKINIFKYSELKNLNNIDELLGKYKRCIILFETSVNNGHFVSIKEVNKKNKKFILFTDSYGLFPENELNYVPYSMKNMLDQERGILFRLLDEQPLQVHYSQYRLQKLDKNVATCGRYSLLACILKDWDEDEFAEFLRSTEYSPDYFVTYLTSDIKGE